jgi:secondary thiamine-phosphate synthase enzyme
MTTYTESITVSTSEMDIVDITQQVADAVASSDISNGVVCIFCPGSTGALTTLEYEPGLLQDLPAALERLAPQNARYQHEERWHDGNGHSHIRASIISPSLTIPIVDNRMTLGTWQQLVFVECDVRQRRRELIVQIIGT